MADKTMICPECRSAILVEWRKAKCSSNYSFSCPVCAIELRVTGAPPIRIHRMDAKGNWQLVQTIAGTPMD